MNQIGGPPSSSGSFQGFGSSIPINDRHAAAQHAPATAHVSQSLGGGGDGEGGHGLHVRAAGGGEEMRAVCVKTEEVSHEHEDMTLQPPHHLHLQHQPVHQHIGGMYYGGGEGDGVGVKMEGAHRMTLPPHTDEVDGLDLNDHDLVGLPEDITGVLGEQDGDIWDVLVDPDGGSFVCLLLYLIVCFGGVRVKFRVKWYQKLRFGVMCMKFGDLVDFSFDPGCC